MQQTDVAMAQVTQPTAPAAQPVIAAAVPAPAQPAPAEVAQGAGGDDLIAARISAATEVAQLAYAARISPRENDPIAKLTEMAQIRAGDQDMIAAAPAAPVEVEEEAGSAEGGWHIQVGAVPTIEGAEALLDKAQDSMGTVLASADPLTQRIQKDGTTLYRARFAGFSGKEEARATCAKLKSKSISCLAVPNG